MLGRPFFERIVIIVFCLFPLSLQSIGVGVSWSSEVGFSLYAQAHTHGFDRKYAAAWSASVVDIARVSQVIQDNPSLDNTLFFLSYALRLFLPVSELYANDQAGDLAKIAMLGFYLVSFYFGEDAGLPMFPLLAKKCGKSTLCIKKRIDQIIADQGCLNSYHDITHDSVFISSMQDMFSDICHIVLPMVIDTVNDKTLSDEIKRRISYVSQADLAFISRLIWPIVFLRLHFGVWMPDMTRYILYNTQWYLSYRLAIPLAKYLKDKSGLFQGEARPGFFHDIKTLAFSGESTKDSPRWAISQSDLKMRTMMVDKMGLERCAVDVFLDGQKLLFWSESVAKGFIYNHPTYGQHVMRYPDQIDMIEDVWDIMKANKAYLEQR